MTRVKQSDVVSVKKRFTLGNLKFLTELMIVVRVCVCDESVLPFIYLLFNIIPCWTNFG